MQSIYNFWKSVQYWERKFLKIFGLFFIRFVLANPRVISNKIPWSIQSSKQRRFIVLINIFFSRSHVSYCPFVWVWHSRILHNKIFRFHLQEETFIIKMFARRRQTCFYSQWQFRNSSCWIMWGLKRHRHKKYMLIDWYFMESKKLIF